MQNRTFIPYESFGELKFGDNYIAVREKLNSPYTEQFKDDTKILMYDFIDDLGLRIEYDNEGNLLGIEVFNDSNLDFIFEGQILSEMSYPKIEKFLRAIDDAVEPFSIGIYSKKYGFSVCGEGIDDDEKNKASSFSLIRKDYMEVNK
jgi:uncharacterized protein YuzE